MEYSLYRNEYELCNPIDEGKAISKIRKIDETLITENTSETAKEIINDWIAEYKTWYKISFGKGIFQKKEPDEVVPRSLRSDTQIVAPEYIYPNEGYNERNVTDVPNLLPESHVASAVTHQFIMANGRNRETNSFSSYIFNRNQQTKSNTGYWGPLLRYGTYGVYKIYAKAVSLNRGNLSRGTVVGGDNVRLPLHYPLDPPLRIRMPRQAMICTLQSKIKTRSYDLKKLEKDPILHMGINYSAKLEQITKQCGTCPRYLYTKVNHLPSTEREYFTFLNRVSTCDKFLSLDGSIYSDMKSSNEFFACELQIGDIIISQGFALWKRRAREICAKNAFKVFEAPCYLVGSIRYWYGTDYMTACITDDPAIVPFLPPFITDPTEPLYKKDEKINESDPEENFDILNPKSLHDFWLYAPTLKPDDNIKNINPQTLLYQSAEFSQMNLSFEVESCWDESFACTVLIDKSPAIKVEGLGSLEQACQAASLVLVDKLVDTQPIVVLKEAYHAQFSNLENNLNVHDNAFLVSSLMWAKHDLNTPIDFRDLSDLITPETFLSINKLQTVSSKDVITSETDMEYLFNIYAQSSLINPLRMLSSYMLEALWPAVPHRVRRCGLIVLNECTDGICVSRLVSKQVPHTQMQAMLMKDKSFGAFTLLFDGTLPNEYLSNLTNFICYNNTDNDACGQDTNQIVSQIQIVDQINTNARTESSRLYSDIINDIPRDLIPGLDF